MPLSLELYKIPSDRTPSQPDSAPTAWPRSVHTIATGSRLIHVTISAVPSSTDGEDATAALTAHSEPPAISVFVVMRDPWHTVQFRLWPERIPKAEVGLFRPDSEWQAEIQAALAAAAGGGAMDEEGEVEQAIAEDEDDMVVDGATPPPGTPAAAAAAAEGTPQPPSPSPTPPPETPDPVALEDTTFRFQLYGPFFKIISYKYSANAALGNLRILAGTTRPLLVGTQAGDRRAAPALHDLWAYADLVPPPPPHPRWSEDGERREAGEAERGWVDAALRRRESPAAVAQLALPPRAVRERFSRGVSAIEWDDWSMSMCGVCAEEPRMIYLYQFAPTPTEKQDGHRFPIPVYDVDERFRCVPEDDPFEMTGLESTKQVIN
ncbi:hypothetical protein EI94DRAFT_593033 [Lactarius quietus]|nr:hypothetical protein EI94DRAFT_593033 [Lactarius quietus]